MTEPEHVSPDQLVNSPTAQAISELGPERRLRLLPETGTPITPGGGPAPEAPTRRVSEAAAGPVPNVYNHRQHVE